MCYIFLRQQSASNLPLEALTSIVCKSRVKHTVKKQFCSYPHNVDSAAPNKHKVFPTGKRGNAPETNKSILVSLLRKECSFIFIAVASSDNGDILTEILSNHKRRLPVPSLSCTLYFSFSLSLCGLFVVSL